MSPSPSQPNGLNAVQRANAESAASAIENARILAAEVDRIQRQRDEDQRNAAIAARALEQRANDNLTDLGADVAKLTFILGGLEPTPADAPPAPPADTPAPAPVPAPADAPPAPPADTPAPAPVPAPAPAAAATVPIGTVATTQNVNQLDPRGWNWKKYWVIIAIATVASILITAIFWEWVVQDRLMSAGETLGTILSILYWIAGIGVGFFGAGFFTARREERLAVQAAQAAATPPAAPAVVVPAVPVAPVAPAAAPTPVIIAGADASSA